MRRSRTTTLVLVLLVLLSLVTPAIVAEPPSPVAAMKDRLWRTGERPPMLDEPPAPPPGPETAAQDTTVEWYRRAWQSYRNDNWDIYVQRGDGSGGVWATSDPAADTTPRLNDGATRLVYVSQRDGNAEIYAAQWDGSQPLRLTSDAAADAEPDWSPDSKRIAFASERDGHAQIYVMNADGSGQTRLTWSDENDFAPTWSPDGKRLAWVRQTGDYGAIWVMNADGTNPTPIQSGFRYLENLRWSPSGNEFAFDYDCDGDYMNEIAILGANGYGLTVLDNPGNYGNTWHDQWMGAWGTGQWDCYITEVTYVLQQGRLYISWMTVRHLNPVPGQEGPALMTGRDVQPDWASMDTQPPVVRLQPLPRLIGPAQGSLQLTWTGWDPGPAGLDYWRVERWCSINGSWQKLHEYAQGNSTTPGFFSGYTFAYRILGRDRAGNTSDWAGGLGYPVTVYSAHLAASAVDSREQPVSGARVTTAPAPLTSGSDLTRANGVRDIYLGPAPEATIGASHTGYAAPVTVTMACADEMQARFYLGPADDLVRNGGFEGAALAPWVAIDADRAGLTQVGRSGQGAAWLGYQPHLQPEALIYKGACAPTSQDPLRIGRDAAGHLCMLWGSDCQGQTDLYLSTQQADGTWAPPERILYPHPGGSYRPALANDAAGTLHVAWLEAAWPTTHIYYARRSPQGVWSAPTQISNASYWVDGNAAPEIALDSSGTVHVVWASNGKLCYTACPANGSWSEVTQLVANANSPAMVAAGEQLHLVYLDSDGNLHYRQWTPADGWSTSGDIPIPTALANKPRLAVGPDGQVIVAYLLGLPYEPQFVALLQRTPGGEWSWPSFISGDDNNIQAASVTLSPDGRLHVAWASKTATRYRVRQANGDWGFPTVVSLPGAKDFAAPAVYADNTGLGHVIWGETTAGNRSLYVTAVADPVQIDGQISQAMTVPAGMHAPTLSFFYRLPPQADPADRLEARINGQTVFTTTTATENWTHVWADLSPWTGQAVTLTLALHTAQAGSPTVAYVDDVSLGSWLTPALREVAPAQVPGNAPTMLTLSGDNFLPGARVRIGGTELSGVEWVDEHTVRVTAPLGLRPGAWDVEVINPGGQSALAPTPLRVGVTLQLPSVFRMYW